MSIRKQNMLTILSKWNAALYLEMTL